VNENDLEHKLRTRAARVAVVGLGYAGLPMAVEFARAGFACIGLDVDAAKVEAIARGRSPVSNVTDLFPGPKYVGPQSQRLRIGDSVDRTVDYCSGCTVRTCVFPSGRRYGNVRARLSSDRCLAILSLSLIHI